MNLRNIVQPDMNIARSINLDRDYRQAELISDYHITAKTTEILSRFADSLEAVSYTHLDVYKRQGTARPLK